MNSKFLLLPTALMVAGHSAAEAKGKKSDQRPNILVILADDLGYSDLGCYGSEIHTPNLDKLAKQGVRFNHFYNTSRSCPTRASLLTGLYQHQAGIGRMTFDDHLPGYRGTLSRNAVTIAEVLKESGYATSMVGKWHIAETPLRKDQREWLAHHVYHETYSDLCHYPVNRGFDTHYGTIYGVVDYFDPFSLVEGEVPVKEVPDGYYITQALSDRAVKEVKEYAKDDKPFFMFNVTMQNHSNYGGDFDNFDPQIVAKFKNTSSNKYLNKYLSLMYETDQDVASLLSELSQSDRKTIVVFWGDHQPNDYVVRPIYKEYGLDFDNQTYEQQQQRQKTPFFIWANYDIQEQTNVEISLNYLNILLFETAGLQLDEYQTFRKNLWQGQIPMMNAVGYRNDNGDLVEYDDAPEEIQNLLNEYQNIQYYRMEREYSKKK